MNVTRNVVLDLLPAYAAGESHADTARLVESWLRDDPAIARELAALRGVDAALESPERMAGEGRPGADQELRALRLTRVALRVRSTLLGIALFFTLLPFSVYHDGQKTHWLVLANPGLTITIAAVAVAMWLGWFLFAARLRVRSGV